MDIDAVIWPLHRWRAGRCAEETCKALGQKRIGDSFNFGFFFVQNDLPKRLYTVYSHNCQMVDFFFSWIGGLSLDALW